MKQPVPFICTEALSPSHQEKPMVGTVIIAQLVYVSQERRCSVNTSNVGKRDHVRPQDDLERKSISH